MRIQFDQAQSKFDSAIEHLKQELNSIRAGRANPALVENLQIPVYGSLMPLGQLANINVADPSLLTVAPWDKSNIDEIVKVIKESDIGINPIQDSELIKLPIPALTEERRLEYVKLMKQKVEEARIVVRQIRKDILLGMEEAKEQGGVSEDEHKSKEKMLQDKVDQANEKIEEIAKDKEKELLKV